VCDCPPRVRRDRPPLPSRRSSDLKHGLQLELAAVSLDIGTSHREQGPDKGPPAGPHAGQTSSPRAPQEAHKDRLRLIVGLVAQRSEEHTSELQSRENLVCRLLLEK